MKNQRRIKTLENASLLDAVNAYNLAVFAEYKLRSTGEVITRRDSFESEDLSVFRSFLLSRWSETEISNAQRELKNYYKRVVRLRSRVKRLLTYSEPVFATFTFTDEVLQSTSPDTRRQYVRRFLNDNSTEYVANIDFGEKKHREHYHAVVSNRLPPWPFGSCKYLPVETSKTVTVTPKRYAHLSEAEANRLLDLEAEKRLSKYVAKLTNHAIKETADSSRLIYSRSTSPDYEPTSEDLYREAVVFAHGNVLYRVRENELPFPPTGARPGLSQTAEPKQLEMYLPGLLAVPVDSDFPPFTTPKKT